MMTREEYNKLMASNPLWKYNHVEIDDEDEGDDSYDDHCRKEAEQIRKI